MSSLKRKANWFFSALKIKNFCSDWYSGHWYVLQLPCRAASHERTGKSAGCGPGSKGYVCSAQSTWVVPLKSMELFLLLKIRS